MRMLMAFVVVFCASAAQADDWIAPQPPSRMLMPAPWTPPAAYANTPLMAPGYVDPWCPPHVLCSKTRVETQILEKRTTVTVISRPGSSYEINHTGGGGYGHTAGPMPYGYYRMPQRPFYGIGFVSKPIASVSVLGVGVTVNAPILVRR